MQKLHSLGALDIQLSHLDDGQRIAATLTQHNARWHKTYYIKFCKEKIACARRKIAKVRD